MSLIAIIWATLSAAPTVPAVTILLDWSCAESSRMVVIPDGASVLEVPTQCGTTSGQVVIELTCGESCSGRLVDNGTVLASLSSPGVGTIFTAKKPIPLVMRPEGRHPQWLGRLQLHVLPEKVVRVDETALLHLPLRVQITTRAWTRTMNPIPLGEVVRVKPGARVGVQIDRVDTEHVRLRFFSESTARATLDETLRLGTPLQIPCSLAGLACAGDLRALVSEQRSAEH